MGKRKEAKFSGNNRKTPVGYMGSPLHFDWSKALDNVQTGVMAAGLIPAFGNAADLVNAGISGVRSGYAAVTGDTKGAKKHAGNVALNLAAAIPIAGQAVVGGRLAYKAGSTASKIAKTAKTVKKTKEVIKRGDQMVDQVAKSSKPSTSKIGVSVPKIDDGKNRG
tara:strand:+ start:2526 stop:3020 length:495 start_codon:yes stop_codon:yes gene_type:complete